MKVLRYCFAVLTAGMILTSCDDLFGDDAKLVIDPVADAFLEQTVGSETLEAEGISFTTTGPWTSEVVPVAKSSQPMWVSISPDHGDEAGTYTLAITLEANDTGEDRTANIIISCGGQTVTITITQTAAPEVPSQGEVQTPEYKKYVSKLEWEYTDYDGDVEKDVLMFAYDENDRVTSMTRSYLESENDWVRNEWTFNYDIVGEVGLTEVKTDPYETVTHTWTAALDTAGRVSRCAKAGEDEGYMRYEYDKDGYLSACVYGEYDDKDGTVEGGIRFLYTEGLWSAVQYFSTDGGYKESEPDPAPNFDVMYANRHMNDKINIDLNPFILQGEFSVDDQLMWVPVRMCGKFTDCLMEIGGVYDEAVESDVWLEYTTPNVTIPMKYITVRTEVPETGNPIVWTFDADGCPLTATETFNYQEYEVTYDIVVGDTVIGERPEWDPDTDTEVMVKLYDYITTPKQYTKTANSWSCQKVLTVTYRE